MSKDPLNRILYRSDVNAQNTFHHLVVGQYLPSFETKLTAH
jgi:hypothetical protein